MLGAGLEAASPLGLLGGTVSGVVSVTARTRADSAEALPAASRART